MQRIRRSIAALAATMILATAPLAAQSSTESPYVLYYHAMDTSREPQIFRYSPDEGEPRQVTHEQGGVRDFDISADGSSIAYIQGDHLWLSPIDGSAPEKLSRATGYPGFSHDGEYIVYADSYPGTIWLYNRNTRETRQILADIDVEDGYSHPDTFRKYKPDQFVLDSSGRATGLIIQIHGWGWKSVGVYDLESGELQELLSTPHIHALPLSDGRMLFYDKVFESPTESAVMHIAENLTDINATRELFSANRLTDNYVSIDAAIELRPGVVRISGVTADASHAFSGGSVYFLDIDLATGVAGDLHLVGAPRPDSIEIESLSPDGRLLLLHLNPITTSLGVIYQGSELLDLETGQTVGQFQANAYRFTWRK